MSRRGPGDAQKRPIKGPKNAQKRPIKGPEEARKRLKKGMKQRNESKIGLGLFLEIEPKGNR